MIGEFAYESAPGHICSFHTKTFLPDTLMFFTLIGGLFHLGINPAQKRYQRSIPVDGNFVACIGACSVDVGLIGLPGRVRQTTVSVVLLARIGAAGEQAGHGGINAVGRRNAMVDVLGGLVAIAGHIAISGGITA